MGRGRQLNAVRRGIDAGHLGAEGSQVAHDRAVAATKDEDMQSECAADQPDQCGKDVGLRIRGGARMLTPVLNRETPFWCHVPAPSEGQTLAPSLEFLRLDGNQVFIECHQQGVVNPRATVEEAAFHQKQVEETQEGPGR